MEKLIKDSWGSRSLGNFQYLDLEGTEGLGNFLGPLKEDEVEVFVSDVVEGEQKEKDLVREARLDIFFIEPGYQATIEVCKRWREIQLQITSNNQHHLNVGCVRAKCLFNSKLNPNLLLCTDMS